MEEAELTIEIDGSFYFLIVSYDTKKVDDTFTGHLGGYLYDYKGHHYEVDKETIDVTLCQDGDDNDIDYEDVPGLWGSILCQLEDYQSDRQ